MKNQDFYEAFENVIIKNASGSYKTLGYIVNEENLARILADAIPRKCLRGSWNRWRDMFLRNLKGKVNEKEI